MARKIELLETTIDENGHPVSSEVVHPLTSADCVVMENGATLDKVMGDGIATPTVTHESASFQVGVGDSNIEVVDGDVAGMTLEGKSYHNILPKPTTLIMETDEKEFKINDKIDNSIVLNDNVAEIATVKGKTYVNVIQEESATEYITLGEELSGQSITTTGKPEGYVKNATLEGSTKYHDIDNDTVLDEFDETKNLELISVNNPKIYATGKNLFDGILAQGYIGDSSGEANTSTTGVHSLNYIKVKPNTTYTRKITGNRPSNFTARTYFYDTNKTYLRPYIDGATFTTPENAYYMRFRYHVSSGSIAPSDFSESIIQIEEGTATTSYEPYKGVTIEQSIDSTPLTSDMFEQGGIDAGNNSVTNGMSYQQFPKEGTSTNKIKSKTLIPVKPNAKYKINFQGYAIMFDKNGGYVKLGSQPTLNFTSGVEFTIPSNVHYMVLCMKNSDNSNITPSTLDSLNLTLQEVTDEIVLRSLPNGVKDTLNLTTGEYVQRVGEVVLDGSESWNKDTTSGGTKDNTAIFFTETNFNGFKPSPNVDYRDTMMLCDKFPIKARVYNLDEEGMMINQDGRIYIRINQSRLETVDMNGFKKFLLGNNVKVECELATPIIKKVNLTNTTKLPSYGSTTHYDTIVPSNSLVPNIKIPSTIDYNVAIKPSTQYTIKANTTSAMSVNLGGSTGTLANGRVTLTTPSTLAHDSLKLGNGKVKELMVIEGSEIKDNVPFFNGMKNVQMGGIKLVNVARGATISGTACISANTNNTAFTYNGQSDVFQTVGFGNTLLKPNTTYTVYVNIIENTSNLNYPIKFLVSGDSVFVDFKGVGIQKRTITTSDKIGRIEIAFRPCTSSQKVVVANPMIIEGDWTHLDEIPFIESEMIIEQPIIRSQGKNLVLPFNNWEQNKIVGLTITSTSINGTPSHGGFAMLQKIYLDKDKEYWLSHSTRNGNSGRIRLRKINSSKDIVVANIFTNSTNGSLRVGETGYYYLTIENNGNTTDSIEISNLQLEEGSTATTYEPFKQHTLSSNRVIGYEEGVHYGGITGIKSFNADFNSVLADVEGLSIAYVTNGSSNFSFWDKDMVYISGKSYLDTSLSSDNKNGFIQVPSNAKYMKFASSIFASNATYYAKATVTGDLPLRSLPNGVCDSFNLVTGEYVQRVGEVVLDGINIKPKWIVQSVTNNITSYFDFERVFTGAKTKSYAFSDKFVYEDYLYNDDRTRYTEGIRIGDEGWGSIRIFNSRLETPDYNGFVKWLQQNPVTVQYELATPIVRKIGLTAKGNYKEVELNGGERVGQNPELSKKFHVYDLNLANDGQQFTLFTNKEQFTVTNSAGNYTVYKYKNGADLVMIINENINTVDLFKRWLSQNPIKVSYLTNNSASLYSNIQKPIFFNNVKVQFMNDNVDIQPTLTLQSTSRNSYVMDMMKANTKYTLKALANPKSFTIDGTSYNATTNGTFTSPSTLTNKLLITGQDVQELMIIEGDVTGKQLPYYKGIRSSFDNTDKVEVLSQNKNLFDINAPFTKDGVWSTVIEGNSIISTRINDNVNGAFGAGFRINHIKPNTVYTLSWSSGQGHIYVYNNSGLWGTGLSAKNANEGSSLTFTTKSDTKYITIGFNYGKYDVGAVLTTTDIKLEEGSVATSYQPHKENSTIINMPTRWETVEVVRPILEKGSILKANGKPVEDETMRRPKNFIPVEPNTNLTFMNGNAYRAENVIFYDINKNYMGWLYTNGSGDLVVPDNCYFIKFYSGNTNTNDLVLIKKQYKPIALNELPNGVKDELIINRATSSAKLVRRVGKVVLDGSENWWINQYYKKTTQFIAHNIIKAKNATRQEVVCDKLQSVTDFYTTVNDSVWIFDSKHLVIHNSSSTSNQLKDWLKQNPLTVYYELAEPVITEIRLKGYPFIYEDGSITLNTDIAPVTRTSYNVNQHQLINSQNETIIRHDKQISDLYDYIGIYLDEIYRMELFKMQLELSL